LVKARTHGRQIHAISLGFSQKLFNRLITSTTEDEVKVIIDEFQHDKSIKWKPFGGRHDNLGTIQNQAKDPVSALVEKATNSIDAVILKVSKKSGIQPRSMQEAMSKFFGINSQVLA